MDFWFRNLRGWIYRRYPAFRHGWYQKKRAGYERRWGLEKRGFTKEGFFTTFRKQVLAGLRPGVFLELVAGDGLVGSFGVWLEEKDSCWKVEAWEHRDEPFRSFQKHRPGTPVHPLRLTQWTDEDVAKNPMGITTRGAREASGVCRAIREGRIRPELVGIWNPSGRPVWYHRLIRMGYRLELVWQNLEFYVDGRRGTGLGSRGTRVGSEKSGDRGQGSGVREFGREK